MHGIQARVVVRWLAEALSGYMVEMPDDRELELMKICVILGFEIVDFVRLVDHHTREANVLRTREFIPVLPMIL
jgi:hypothetical protein